MKKVVQTAGRNALGTFAPDFAHYNDDVLFGENWNNQDIDLKNKKHHNRSSFNGIRYHRLFFKNSIYRMQKAHGVTPEKRSQPLSPMLLFMQAGQRAGLYLIWQRKYGQIMKATFHTKMRQ